jgi:hypothetical protein
MGGVFAGERVVFRGLDLFHDLGDVRWMELYLYGITGRRFSEKQVLLFESMWSIGTSYPDPRIWNNRIASLAGTTRSTATLGISAATAISEAKLFGRQPDIRAIDFLLRARKAVADGVSSLEEVILDEMQKNRGIAGFRRPLTNADERIAPILAVARKLGYAHGAHLQLAFGIERWLLEKRYRLKMNAAAFGAALAADQGLSAREYYLFQTPSFIGGMLPCYIEASERPEGSFLPLRCTRIEYSGKAPRQWEK